MAAVVKLSWWGRLRRRRRAGPAAADQAPAPERDPLEIAGQQLRQAREARGINLRELALETRISTPVLEALERGWRQRLPEMAYLRTMLPLLERHLELEPGTLRQAVSELDPQRLGRARVAPTQPLLLPLQLFSTWQGTAVYAISMLLLLYALNLEQRRLAARGLLALKPLPPMSESVRRTIPPVGSDLLLSLYPELQPLALAGRGQAMALFNRGEGVVDKTATDQRRSGVLALQLSRPTRLQLLGVDGQRQSLQVDAGELQLPLPAQAQLQLEPAPALAPEVLWNGEPLSLEAPGRYRWPRAAISP